ncbi:MAG: copper-binding protein [Betaproteobacteria bacterium]|nr:copper-binding protein [Betaproteobacteria bacterium]MDH5211872.1 copper-binding protein [Betaproteobacteria bacterium]
MSTKTIVVLALSASASLVPLYAAAQQGRMDHGSMGQGAAGQPGTMQMQTGDMADGEIRKVDKDAGKLTIKHGAIPSMDMPPMTMVYRVKDPAMLDQVKPGDTVKFSMEKVGGQYMVTRLGVAK